VKKILDVGWGAEKIENLVYVNHTTINKILNKHNLTEPTKRKKKRIKYIRGAIHSPTTQGKVERLFQTFKREFSFCNNDVELWRMRYNHFRQHTSLNNKTPDEIIMILVYCFRVGHMSLACTFKKIMEKVK